MQLSEAISLLKHPLFEGSGKTVWADLGCGNGLFTLALASLLQPGSIIFAVDKNGKAIQQIPEPDGITLEKIKADFMEDRLPVKNLDGVLMANSLHFVKDKQLFLQKMMKWMKPAHALCIVEYDTDKANRWVPYPISFNALKELLAKEGYSGMSKINERPSTYSTSLIYAAIALFRP